MNAKPFLAYPHSHPHVRTTIIAAALSALIAIALLSAVAGLFLRDGTPLEQIVIAEHACADYAFVSEREACIRSYLAASQVAAPEAPVAYAPQPSDWYTAFSKAR
jgi:hypothetical protein